jgi:hypothetical protein
VAAVPSGLSLTPLMMMMMMMIIIIIIMIIRGEHAESKVIS